MKKQTLSEDFRELRQAVIKHRTCSIEFELRNDGIHEGLGMTELPDDRGQWRVWDGQVEKQFCASRRESAMNQWRSYRMPGTIRAQQIDEVELMIREVEA